MIQNHEEGLITAGGTSRGTWIGWRKKWVDRNLSRVPSSAPGEK